MSRNVAPFPEPPIPEIDAQGLRVPPWIKYPNIPLGSIGWRMGAGEDYWFSFRDWWFAQPGAIRLQVKALYPEPGSWSGFYGRLKDV
ncbi:hypothetical protein ACKQC9_30890 [Klebsiella michiganensis]|uniref:hypothetical protein n=1 Tax=Klebsiella michiganensis TaxID=1134687 RepID=UPI003D6DBA9D